MHEFDRGVTTYDIMPIPPVEAHSQRFDAGAISIWVEYRLLDDAIAAAHTVSQGRDDAATGIDDRGVSLHVFGPPNPTDANSKGQAEIEYLRFDCFDEDPHYHYVSYENTTNQMVHLDPHAHGDPLVWALCCIRTRLPQMLERAGAPRLAAQLEPSRLEAVLPRVTEAAFRARFSHDDAAIHAGALAGAESVGKTAGNPS